MTKENLSRLQALEREHQIRMYPSVPEHGLAKSKFSDNSANNLTKSIVSFLNFSGHFAERINTMGVYRAAKKVKDVDGITRTVGKGTYTKSTSTNGSSDISATISGRSVKIEVKMKTDRQSQAQKDYEKRTIQAGGFYFIAKDFDSFIEWYDELLNKIS